MADSGDEFSMKGQLYMEFGYVYETGVRERNEDALLLRNSLFAKGELILAAVCDGMGGMESGVDASFYCIREMEEWYDAKLIPVVENYGMNPQKLKRVIRSKGFQLYQQMNKKLFERMRVEKVRMGTTATMCIVFRDYFYLFHLGDSRCYRFSRGIWGTQIRRMTKDHGTAGGLSRCLGLNKEWKPDFLTGKSNGHHFLLCTDGFWRRQDLQLWKRCMEVKKMSDGNIRTKRLKTIVDYNLRMGEKDNISAVYIGR